MYGFILGLLIMTVGLLPHVSLAQLDLEELLTEPEAVEEKVSADETTTEDTEAAKENSAEATENAEATAAEDVASSAKDEATEETVAESDATAEPMAESDATAETETNAATEPEESAESILPEDIDEKPEATPAETETAEPTKAETPAEDDFMAQYIDELSEQEQENSQAKEVRSNAMQLIMQKDNTAVISDDYARELQERSAKIREEQKKLLQEEDNKETVAEEQTAEPEKVDEPEKVNAPTVAAEPNKNAPFGLTWGASQEDTAAAGFELEKVSAENMTNIFLIKNPRQKRAVFNEVMAVFGEQNHLYAVYAKTPAQADTPNAEKTLKLYHEYYAALEKKYGNAKEHYSPNKEHSTSLKEVGYDHFLQDLKDEKAFLYATFSDETLKVTLSIFADADTHGYITLDYENTQIQSQEKEENLNDLINDL